MQIDAVEQRAADFCQVALDDAGRATAFAGSVAVETAGVRLRNLVPVAKSRLYCRNLNLRIPPKPLNLLGIPEKPCYRTADVCTVLGIKPELFRYRLYTQKYPEFERDGKGRLFSIEDLRTLIEISEHLA